LTSFLFVSRDNDFGINVGILHEQACKSIGTSLRSQWQLITEIKNTQNLDYGNGNAPIIQGKKGKSNNVIITHNLCTYLS
jgi:hypothetical protein